jgi:Sec7-like guanine-nucleotide exchange factor
MHVIAHQYISMQLTRKPVSRLAQVIQVTLVISSSKKAQLAIVTALNDMLGNPR